MANRRFGWHSGTLKCKDIIVENDLSITGDLSFGDASTDTLTVTGTLAVTGTESVATGIAAVQMTSDGTTAASAAGWCSRLLPRSVQRRRLTGDFTPGPCC